MMRLGIFLALLLLAVLLFMGFVLTQEPTGVTDEEWGQIWEWLSCEECVEGELWAVRRIGPRAVPILSRELRDVSDAREANMSQRYEATWATIPNPSMTMDDFVDHNVGNFLAVTQRRAAVALAALNQLDTLVVAKDEADVRGYRSDVLGELVALTLAGLSDKELDNGEMAVSGPTGVFFPPFTSVRRCASWASVDSPPEPGQCITYSGPTAYPFIAGPVITDTGMGPDGRTYSWSIKEGIYEVPYPVGNHHLIWVRPGAPPDTVRSRVLRPGGPAEGPPGHG